MLINEDNKTRKNYAALGSFDGLHKGHLQLVKNIVSLAEESKGESIVYTFKNHPRSVIFPDFKEEILMSNEEKAEILKKYKVDYVHFQEFDKEFMEKSPEEFIKDIIKDFNLKGIVVGFNYRFGYKNLGDTKFLKHLSEKYNFELYVIDPCEYEGEVISSSRIRQELLKGNIEKANEMLSRPYSLNGLIVHGKEIGRTIGFPTANLESEKKFLLPEEGVYYTNILWNNNRYKSITSIGNNPTVNGEKITVESHILDFNKSIYGEKIKVDFIKKIRNNVKFGSIEELKEQLECDKTFAEKEKF